MGAYTSAATQAAILDAHQQGKSKAEISRSLGINRVTLLKIIRSGEITTTTKIVTTKYSEFYAQAELRIKGGATLTEAFNFDGPKPAWGPYYAWVQRKNLTFKKGQRGSAKKIKKISFNKELYFLLQKRLVSTIMRLKPLYKNPLYKEELIAEMGVVSLQYHMQYNPLLERLPDDIMKSASSAADKLLTLLGCTKTEERRAAVLQAQEWATFDYETRNGQVLKQVFAAYQLFGMKGVLKEVIPHDISSTEKLLKQFCPKKI